MRTYIHTHTHSYTLTYTHNYTYIHISWMIVFGLILKVFNDEVYIVYIWLRVGY
jgi:hypothetical protein